MSSKRHRVVRKIVVEKTVWNKLKSWAAENDIDVQNAGGQAIQFFIQEKVRKIVT